MTDAEYVNAHRPMLQQMMHGAFSGSVDHDTRKALENIAHQIDWKLIVCWTCGGSLAVMARLILNQYPE